MSYLTYDPGTYRSCYGQKIAFCVIKNTQKIDFAALPRLYIGHIVFLGRFTTLVPSTTQYFTAGSKPAFSDVLRTADFSPASRLSLVTTRTGAVQKFVKSGEARRSDAQRAEAGSGVLVGAASPPPPAYQLGVWGSGVSSSSGVRGRSLSKIDFCVF